MQRGSRKIEQMPYRVKVPHFFSEREKHDPAGVGDPAREQQPKARGRHQPRKFAEAEQPLTALLFMAIAFIVIPAAAQAHSIASVAIPSAVPPNAMMQ